MTTTIDPVCGEPVDEAAACAEGRAVEHHGRTYVFCSEACRDRFLAAPDRFAPPGATIAPDVERKPDDLHPRAGEL